MVDEKRVLVGRNTGRNDRIVKIISQWEGEVFQLNEIHNEGLDGRVIVNIQ